MAAKSTLKNRSAQAAFRRIIALLLAAVLAAMLFSGCEKRRIEAIVPADRGTLSAANATITEYCENYRPGIADELQDFTDMYFPHGLDLRWSYRYEDGSEKAEADEPAYAYVLFSQNKDMSDARRYLTASKSVHIDDVYTNTDYYWQVEAVYNGYVERSGVFKLHVANNFRTFNVPSVSNTRDLGGYAGKDGKKVRQGMIFRGGNLDGVSSASKKVLIDELGIHTDLDLRAPGEGKAGGETSPLGAEINYVNISAPLYLGIKEEEKAEALAAEIRVFADESNYPVYFHCAIGRDRTGTLALMLLGLLGVSEDLIRRDYEMSFLSKIASSDKAVPSEMIKVNFDPTIEYVRSFGGKNLMKSTELYLKSIGITDEEIAEIRRIMLE